MSTFKPTYKPPLVLSQYSGDWFIEDEDGTTLTSIEDKCNGLLDMLHMANNAPTLADALRQLQDPEGHIFHGAPGATCTGECKAVRAALAAYDTNPRK